ncbi:CD3337/EF1877 family mobilome membrane protein, partial [Bacillus cytotoxicus]
SDVDAPEQGEQDDPSEYETENQEGNNEELAEMDGNNDEEENPELSDVEDIEQPGQDDSSDYETEQEEGDSEALLTSEDAEADSAQHNEPLSDVETPEQVEQDDSSEYEAGHEEGSTMERATTEGSTMDSQNEHTEVADVETTGNQEQDNVSEYETGNGEGGSNQFTSVGQVNSQEETSNSTEKAGEGVPSLDGKQEVINSSGIDQESGGENEFVLSETHGKELTSTKGLEVKSSTKIEGSNLEGNPIGSDSTKVSSVGEYGTAEPSGMGVNTGSMNVNDIQGASVESSGDLTMTSSDSLESSGSIPGQTMSGSSLGEQKGKGQSFEGSQILQGKESSQEVVGTMEAKPSEHVESSQADKINRTNETTHIESAQAEVAASQEVMIDATQQKVELETLAEENEIKIETETETI